MPNCWHNGSFFFFLADSINQVIKMLNIWCVWAWIENSLRHVLYFFFRIDLSWIGIDWKISNFVTVCRKPFRNPVNISTDLGRSQDIKNSHHSYCKDWMNKFASHKNGGKRYRYWNLQSSIQFQLVLYTKKVLMNVHK